MRAFDASSVVSPPSVSARELLQLRRRFGLESPRLHTAIVCGTLDTQNQVRTTVESLRGVSDAVEWVLLCATRNDTLDDECIDAAEALCEQMRQTALDLEGHFIKAQHAGRWATEKRRDAMTAVRAECDQAVQAHGRALVREPVNEVLLHI